MSFSIKLKVCFIRAVKMFKVVLIFGLIAIVSARGEGGCHGKGAATATSTIATLTTASNDGSGVIQARAQPTTTINSRIDDGVEIIDLNRN